MVRRRPAVHAPEREILRRRSLQKTFVENCISKKTRKNNGELPKYLVQNHHGQSLTVRFLRKCKRKSPAVPESGRYPTRPAKPDSPNTAAGTT